MSSIAKPIGDRYQKCWFLAEWVRGNRAKNNKPIATSKKQETKSKGKNENNNENVMQSEVKLEATLLGLGKILYACTHDVARSGRPTA